MLFASIAGRWFEGDSDSGDGGDRSWRFLTSGFLSSVLIRRTTLSFFMGSCSRGFLVAYVGLRRERRRH